MRASSLSSSSPCHDSFAVVARKGQDQERHRRHARRLSLPGILRRRDEQLMTRSSRRQGQGRLAQALLARHAGGTPAVCCVLLERNRQEGPDLRRPLEEGADALTNGLSFSYPGYSEIFCGFADPNINSNAKKPTESLGPRILERKPAYKQGRRVLHGRLPSIFAPRKMPQSTPTGSRSWMPLTERQKQ